jgi:hypothetical protein
MSGEVATPEFWNNQFPSPMPGHYAKADQVDNPLTVQEALENGFKPLPASLARWHRQGEGNEYNIKLVHSDGREAVYNKEGKLVTDPLNLGTKNSQNPGNLEENLQHFFSDVVPYFPMGNNKKDEPGPGGMVKRLLANPPIPDDYDEHWKEVYNYNQNKTGAEQ